MLTSGTYSLKLRLMEVSFGDANLDQLEIDARFDGGYSQAIVKAYRKRMQQIRAAEDERPFTLRNPSILKNLRAAGVTSTQ